MQIYEKIVIYRTMRLIVNCQFDISLILIGMITNIPDYKDSVFLVK